LRQIFRYALVKVPGLEYNYASDLDVVAVPQRPTRNNPFLRLDELPELLQTVQAYDNATIRQALRLLLLTGVRTGELLHATPEQFDLERGLWSVPPENVKQLQRKMRQAGKPSQRRAPRRRARKYAAYSNDRYRRNRTFRGNTANRSSSRRSSAPRKAPGGS
jgi:integrase